jgi:hypothetical protein
MGLAKRAASTSRARGLHKHVSARPAPATVISYGKRRRHKCAPAPTRLRRMLRRATVAVLTAQRSASKKVCLPRRKGQALGLHVGWGKVCTSGCAWTSGCPPTVDRAGTRPTCGVGGSWVPARGKWRLQARLAPTAHVGWEEVGGARLSRPGARRSRLRAGHGATGGNADPGEKGRQRTRVGSHACNCYVGWDAAFAAHTAPAARAVGAALCSGWQTGRLAGEHPPASLVWLRCALGDARCGSGQRRAEPAPGPGRARRAHVPHALGLRARAARSALAVPSCAAGGERHRRGCETGRHAQRGARRGGQRHSGTWSGPVPGLAGGATRGRRRGASSQRRAAGDRASERSERREGASFTGRGGGDGAM